MDVRLKEMDECALDEIEREATVSLFEGENEWDSALTFHKTD